MKKYSETDKFQGRLILAEITRELISRGAGFEITEEYEINKKTGEITDEYLKISVVISNDTYEAFEYDRDRLIEIYEEIVDR